MDEYSEAPMAPTRPAFIFSRKTAQDAQIT